MTIGNIRKFEANMESGDASVLEAMLSLDGVFFEDEGTEIAISVMNNETDTIAQINIILNEFTNDAAKNFKVNYAIGSLFDGCYPADRLDVIAELYAIKQSNNR